jgi:hypothetical protein
MKVYHRTESHFGKWIVAALAFLIVMSISFADVYGITVPNKPGDSKGKDPQHKHGQTQNQSDTKDKSNRPEPGPTPTPEPSTMILMGLGLGAASMAKKFKKVK